MGKFYQLVLFEGICRQVLFCLLFLLVRFYLLVLFYLLFLLEKFCLQVLF